MSSKVDHNDSDFERVFFVVVLFCFFVSPELSSVRDYVITHSVRSMYVVCVCMWYFAKLITVSTYIDVLSWDLDTMILG